MNPEVLFITAVNTVLKEMNIESMRSLSTTPET